MYKLHEKQDISGTFWIEFNAAGSEEYYDHWHDTSRFVAPDAMLLVAECFSSCIENFDTYRPIFIEPYTARQVGGMLEVFASAHPKSQASKLAVDLAYFLVENARHSQPVWMLGV